MKKLELDDYTRPLLAFYESSLEWLGPHCWRYADLATVTLAASRLLEPKNYLEVGVRMGRSMAMVVSQTPGCNVVGFDTWENPYHGTPNPGAYLVESEIAKFGHTGRLELVSGDSHHTLHKYFIGHPHLDFDLITVDGDHSMVGAEIDLRDVLPRLAPGGVVVLDDVVLHPYLHEIWKRLTYDRTVYTPWCYGDFGFGVVFAKKRS
jgi:predicted O-methyltransferase YrrM